MFLRCNRRRKDGKEHYYWNIVENKRVSGGRVVQRQVLYLGEINDSEAWRKSIEIFEEGRERPEQVALFPEDRAPLWATKVLLEYGSKISGSRTAMGSSI